MARSQIGAQLYTVREFTKTPKDIAETMKKIKKLGYDAVQLSALGPIEITELKKILHGEGLVVVATHTSFDRLQKEINAVIDEHKLLGCKYVAIGSMPRGYRSKEGYEKFAREATEVGKKLADAGLVFGYHNHGFEFQKYGDRLGLEILYEESDARYVVSELDTYWVQYGGGDPAAWIRRLKDRSPIIHLKDMTIIDNKQEMAEVGEGNLNWPAILDACREAKVEWYLVEQDRCQRDPFESLAISLRNLREMGIY